MKNTKNRLTFAPSQDPSILRKQAPKYLHSWTINDMNSFPFHQYSNSLSSISQSIKRAKLVNRIRFSGDITKKSVPFFSQVIKRRHCEIKKIVASRIVWKKLRFLHRLNLTYLSVHLDQSRDWRLLLYSRSLCHLKIFTEVLTSYLFSFYELEENRGEVDNGNATNSILEQDSKKIYQLKRHSKSLWKLQDLSINGEYDVLLIRILQTFDKNLQYLTCFHDLDLTLSYKQPLSQALLEEIQHLQIWRYMSHILTTSVDLLRHSLGFGYKFKNLQQLDLFSLFTTDQDYSFFQSLSLVPSLREIDILMYGHSLPPALIGFLSSFSLPNHTEKFSLTINNSIPGTMGQTHHTCINKINEAPFMQDLAKAWQGLHSLREIHIRIGLLFRASDVYVLGSFFQRLKALKELDLEIINDFGGINMERLYQAQDPFDLIEFLMIIHSGGIKLEKLSIGASSIVIDEVPKELGEMMSSLKGLVLRGSLHSDGRFEDFLKMMPRELNQLLIDQIVVVNDNELEYMWKGLADLVVTKELKFTVNLEEKVKEEAVVDKVIKMVRHFKRTEEFVVFLNNYMLRSKSFLEIKEAVMRSGKKLEHVKGQVSDFNCNLYWSCNDRRIYYSQLDLICEDLY